jgi:hypothetical protein
MTTTHWFWLGLTTVSVLWYLTITVYVAVRGAWDIQHMLAQLDALRTPRSDVTPDDRPRE